MEHEPALLAGITSAPETAAKSRRAATRPAWPAGPGFVPLGDIEGRETP